VATTPESLQQHSIVTLEESGPEWLPQTEEALRKLLSLPQNWNSYGARPIQPQNVDSAVQLLHQLAGQNTPQPIVVPTVRGGVQLEWHTDGIDLEIEINEPGRFQVLYEQPSKDMELELEVTPADLSRLVELTAQLVIPFLKNRPMLWCSG
jgi:hypothetical protein